MEGEVAQRAWRSRSGVILLVAGAAVALVTGERLTKSCRSLWRRCWRLSADLSSPTAGNIGGGVVGLSRGASPVILASSAFSVTVPDDWKVRLVVPW
jgi:hypothetical protein